MGKTARVNKEKGKQPKMTKAEFNDWWDRLRQMCGCGLPAEGLKLIRDVLRLTPLYEHRDELNKLLPSDGIQMLVLGTIDALGLIEHGTTIYGAWATEKGDSILAYLNSLGEGEEAWERATKGNWY